MLYGIESVRVCYIVRIERAFGHITRRCYTVVLRGCEYGGVVKGRGGEQEEGGSMLYDRIESVC